MVLQPSCVDLFTFMLNKERRDGWRHRQIGERYGKIKGNKRGDISSHFQRRKEKVPDLFY